MKFVLKRENWTDDAASLWGDLMNLHRPATYEEAKRDLEEHGFDGQFVYYFNQDGSSKGPCSLGLTVETE